jgi:hypothetical protein
MPITWQKPEQAHAHAAIAQALQTLTTALLPNQFGQPKTVDQCQVDSSPWMYGQPAAPVVYDGQPVGPHMGGTGGEAAPGNGEELVEAMTFTQGELEEAREVAEANAATFRSGREQGERS